MAGKAAEEPTNVPELRNSSYDSVPDEFCSPNKSSVENSIQYLHQELQMLGLPGILTKESRQPETSRMVNVLFHLLQLHRHNLNAIDKLKDSLQRGRSDAQFHCETQARLKDDVKSYQRQIALLQDKERQLNDKIKTSMTKLRTEQEEVRRLKLSMQYKQTQRAHESKKREKEYERLKQKLGQLVSDKNQERHSGLSVLNTVQRIGGKRKTWNKPGSGDVEMYQVIVSNYEERLKELMVENASLRESLYCVQKQLISLLSDQEPVFHQDLNMEHNAAVIDVEHTCSRADEALLSGGHFQMPYDIVRDGMEENFKEKCKLVKDIMDDLRTRIKLLEKNQASDCEQGPESSTEQVECCSGLVVGNYKDYVPKSESFVWREQSKLESKRKIFLEQKDEFEKEKQKFMEAVCKLDRERQVFEDEKAMFLREQLLDVSILSSTRELDSFFSTMSSTPAQSLVAQHTRVVKKIMHTKSTTSEVDLQHDLSLSSDDGTSVLNERPYSDLPEEESSNED